MKMNLLLLERLGTVIIFAIGGLFHFGFEFTGKSSLLSVFFPVNESIWEHGKLTFWPVLIYGLIEYLVLHRTYPNLFTAKIFSAVLSTFIMIILFYLSVWIFKGHSFIGDLIIYELSIIAGLLLSYKLMTSPPLPKYLDYISFGILTAAIFIFYLFSYNPPRLPVFRCYVTGKYGVYKY